MDLDALHRNVSRLMKFMERFESAAGSSDPKAPVSDDQVQELKDAIKGLNDRLDSADLAGLRDQMNALDGYKTQIVEPALKDISDILPKLAEVGDMLGWFQQNRENLEGAIAVADEFDGEPAAPPPQTDPATGAEPAPEAPASPAGEGSADPAPADANSGQAS